VQPVAVAPLLAREVALFADLAAAQGVALQVDATPGLPAVLADEVLAHAGPAQHAGRLATESAPSSVCTVAAG